MFSFPYHSATPYRLVVYTYKFKTCADLLSSRKATDVSLCSNLVLNSCSLLYNRSWSTVSPLIESLSLNFGKTAVQWVSNIKYSVLRGRSSTPGKRGTTMLRGEAQKVFGYLQAILKVGWVQKVTTPSNVFFFFCSQFTHYS